MACDHCCFKCVNTSTNNDAFDNHERGVCVRAKKRQVRHEETMVNDLAHYLKSGVSKGWQEELAFRTQTVKTN